MTPGYLIKQYTPEALAQCIRTIFLPESYLLRFEGKREARSPEGPPGQDLGAEGWNEDLDRSVRLHGWHLQQVTVSVSSVYTLRVEHAGCDLHT